MKRTLNTGKLYFLFSLSIILISCENNNDMKLVDNSELLINQKSDSALILLESIDYPEEMTEEYYAKYCMLLVSAHLKNRIDIKSDSLIQYSVKYYKDRPENKDKYAQSLLLLGNIYEEQGNLDLAEKCYSQVQLISKQINHTYLLQESAFELGGMNLDLGRYNEAITWFDKVIEIPSDNYNKVIRLRSMRHSADCFALLGRSDTALIIYDKVLSQIAPEKYFVKADIYKNIAIIYQNKKQFRESLYFIQKSINSTNAKTAYPLQYVVLSSIYDTMGKRDSANYYIRQALKYAKEQGNVNTIHQAYESSLETNHPEKLENYLLINSLSSSIFLKQKYATVKYQKLYNVEKMRKQHKELIIERQRYFILSIIIAVILVVVLLYFLSIKKRKKNEFHKELQDKDSIINLIRSSLYQRLEFYVKMVRLSISPNKSKHKDFLIEYNKILFDQEGEFSLNWNIVEELSNNVFNNYANKVYQIDSELNDTEAKIIILLKIGFSVSEIALIFDKSVHTIYRHSSNIRKKLTIPEAESITDFIERKIED